MRFDDAIDLIRKERETQERLFGPRNRTMGFMEWIGVFGQRLSYMIQAAAAANRVWFAEECIKMAATCIAALEAMSEMAGLSLDADGLAEIDGAAGSRPRIVAKVTEAPPDAIRVASDAKHVWVGHGGVWKK